MADPMASLTVKLDTPSKHRWGGNFPIEVRDVSKLMLAARGVSDGKLEVPAGRYFVTALLPDGQQAAVDDIVDLQPGDDKHVEVSIADLAFPATLENKTTFGGSVKEFVRPITQYFVAQNFAIIRGNWLAARIVPDAAAQPIKREPTTRSSIEIKFSQVSAWVEIAGSNGCNYLAVPIDDERSTTMHWDMNANTGKLELKFDFNDGETNSFFDFVQNDQALEARSLGRSIIDQSEQFLMDKRRSPLRAILGAYVLLRANEVDGMDRWTANLVTYFPWMPDALAVRVEYLARNGEHSAASRLLLDVPQWGTPWFRSGIGYLEKRAKLYASVAASNNSGLELGDGDLKKLQKISEVFGELAAALDLTQTTAVLQNIPRIS
jgi:hypothetical protein